MEFYEAAVGDLNATATLLIALGTLYHLLSEQNHDLAEANARLRHEIEANQTG